MAFLDAKVQLGPFLRGRCFMFSSIGHGVVLLLRCTRTVQDGRFFICLTMETARPGEPSHHVVSQECVRCWSCPGLHPVMTVISRVCSTHDLSDLSVGCMNQCSKRRPPFSAGRSLKTSSLAAFFDAKGKRVPSNKWQCIRRLFKSHTTCNLPT